MRALVLLLTVATASSAWASPSYDPTEDLNAAFGGNCSTSGGLTATADSQGAALKGVLTAAKNDKACAGISPLFDSLSASLEANARAKNTRALTEEELTGYINDLKATLVVEQKKPAPDQDAGYIALVQGELHTKKLQLIETKRNNNFSKEDGRHLQVQHLFSSATALMQGIHSNTECANMYPNLMAQVGAQVLKLSADATSGLAGTYLLASGTVVDRLISFIRDNQLAKQIRALREVELSRALGCALESLSTTWCQARDVRYVAAENIRAQSGNSCEWKGVDLIGHDMASFMQWVTRVYAGSPSGNTSQSSEKLVVIQLRAALEGLTEQANGIIGNIQRDLDQIPDSEVVKKENLRKSLIKKLEELVNMNSNRTVNQMGSSMTYSGPIGDAFIADPLCGALTYFYSKGKSKECGPGPNETCEQCLKRTGLTQVPTVNEIKAQVDELVSREAAEYVSRKESLTKENNPQLVLAMADDLLKNRTRPREFLDGSLLYLNYLLDQQDGIAKGTMRKTIEQAKARVETALAVLNDPEGNEPGSNPPVKMKEAKDAVRILAVTLAPGGDTFFLPKELQAIVKRDIDDKIKRGQIDETLAAVMELSTTDSVQELLKNYQNLDKLDLQIDSSQESTRQHLRSLWETFKDFFTVRIESLQADEKEEPSKAKQLAFECARMLLVPFDKKRLEMPEELTKACRGRVHKSVYRAADGNSELLLDFDKLAQKPFSERVCSVYDFFRKSDIYSQTRGRKGARSVTK